MYIKKAKELMRKIHEAGTDDAEWLHLEAEVTELFASLPKDQFHIVSEMFIEDGAGDTLSMVCAGIRYEQEKHT